MSANNANNKHGGDEADRAVYVISVAAELAGMHPQTLRQYDRLGLVSPSRTKGRGRRYTLSDIRRLREVQRLSQEEGINLAGIRRVMELVDQVKSLEEEVADLNEAARRDHPRVRRVFTADSSGYINARSPLVGSPVSVRGASGTALERRNNVWLLSLPPKLARLIVARALANSRGGETG